MTVREIASRLEKSGIASASYDALLLAERFSGKSMPYLRAAMDEELDLDSKNSEKLEASVLKRCRRYPLQYILGEWEFMGLSFEVNESCLIPRSDTEILCEYIISKAPKNSRLLDLCTGSGCIIASVLHYRQDMTGAALELYPDTLRTAERNFKRLGVDGRIKPILGDAASDMLSDGELYEVISANPPYVSTGEMRSLEPELYSEPEYALTDGGDGLSIIKAVMRIYSKHVVSGGFMIIEHGASQGESCAAYASSLGLKSRPIRDYGGNTRDIVMTL